MNFKIANLTDSGNYRKNNQDFSGYEKNKNGDLFAIVCDGMGGHAHGEVASKLAVQNFLSLFKNTDFSGMTNSDVNKWLRKSIEKIVEVMKKYAKNSPDTLDMGTTLTAILFTSNKAFIVNVGDSRTYKYMKGKLFQITRDQNLWNSTPSDEREKLKNSGMYKNKLNDFTYWKVLTSALGPKKSLKIDTYLVNDVPGIYFLTSDGVHDYIDEESMIEILDSKLKLKSKGLEIIEFAKGNFSTDNLSILLIEVGEK